MRWRHSAGAPVPGGAVSVVVLSLFFDVVASGLASALTMLEQTDHSSL